MGSTPAPVPPLEGVLALPAPPPLPAPPARSEPRKRSACKTPLFLYFRNGKHKDEIKKYSPSSKQR